MSEYLPHARFDKAMIMKITRVPVYPGRNGRPTYTLWIELDVPIEEEDEPDKIAKEIVKEITERLYKPID
jgi:hypothetical protein